MSKYKSKILKGSEVRGESLRLPRALSIAKAVRNHPFTSLLRCVRQSDMSEILFIRFFDLNIPAYPEYDIRNTEDIAIVCHPHDLTLPEVYATRLDFPVGLPHSNARDFERPISMCVSDIIFEEMRLQFSAFEFLGYIRDWFEKNSKGKLHEEDRPLEIFFNTQDYCVPIYGDEKGCYARYTKKTKFSSTVEIVNPNDATHRVIKIRAAETVTKNMACLPKKMSDLKSLRTAEGNSLYDEIITYLKSLVSTKKSQSFFEIIEI